MQKSAPSYINNIAWAVKSDSHADVEYIVTVCGVTGRWACTCPHSVYRHAECKHIARLRDGDIESAELVAGYDAKTFEAREWRDEQRRLRAEYQDWIGRYR